MRRTYQPNKRRAQKKHGFFARMKSLTGKLVIKRRRARGRVRLTK